MGQEVTGPDGNSGRVKMWIWDCRSTVTPFGDSLNPGGVW